MEQNSIITRSPIKSILISRNTWTFYSRSQGPRTAKTYQKSLRTLNIIQNSDEQANNNQSMQKLSMSLKNSKSLNHLNLQIKGRIQNPHGLQILAKRLKNLNHLQKLEITTIDTSFSEEIHPFLFFLKHLKSLTALKLSSPPENGFLPMDNLKKSMSQLKNLKHLICLSLDFSNTYHFNVTAIVSISNSLKKCQYLQSLALNFESCDHMPLETIQNLAVSLSSLQHLSSLALNLNYYQSINSASIDLLFKAFKSSRHLRSLSFSFPSYHDSQNDTSQFLQELAHLHPLTSLSLDFSIQNAAHKDLFKNLSYALQAQSQLQILRIKMLHSNIEGPWAEHLAEGFKALQSLSELSFSSKYSKNLHDKVAGDLGEGLSKLTNLSILKLNFHDHNLGQEGLSKILEGVRALKCLQKINLNLYSRDSTSFLLQQAKSLLPFFKTSEIKTLNSVLSHSQNHLTVLKLDFTLFKPAAQDLSLFSAHISSMKQLKTLHLSFDKTKSSKVLQKGLQNIFSNLKQLNNLTDLALKVYYGSNDELQAFFANLKYLKDLEYLKIWFQKLDGLTFETAHQFIEAMENLGKLSELNIDIDFEKSLVEEVCLFLTGIPKIKSLSVLQYDFGRIDDLLPMSTMLEICKNIKTLKSLIYKYDNVIF